jgi:RNA polymerase sigma factor (sigma-70 family)
MRLIENIRKVREPEKLGGWLACTMRRECIRLVNRQRGEQLTDDWTTGDYGLTDGPDDEVLLAERDVLLWDAVDRLPARQRQILLALSADPPQSYEQISVSLSVAVGSIGPIRQRALRRLRDLLHQSGVVDCPSYRLVLTGAREASTC